VQISVIMGYFERPLHLKNTLDSYDHFYSGADLEFEVVIVDDSSRDPSELQDLVTRYDFPIRTEYLDRRSMTVRNPGPVMNRAAELARAPVLALTNPENLHCGPVLTDSLERVAENTYVVYACRTLKVRPDSFEEALLDIDAVTNWSEAKGWYQHGRLNNRLLHFMSLIRKDDFLGMGGFDSVYDGGVGYEDNDLAEQIFHRGFRIVTVDQPFVAHQDHSRGHVSAEGIARNQQIFIRRWRHRERVFRRDRRLQWLRDARRRLRHRLRGRQDPV
jgi:glycosyltransferase involved in cell wall biosynthesis